MTVRDLIAQLSRYAEDTPIVGYSEDNSEWVDADRVEELTDVEASVSAFGERRILPKALYIGIAGR